MIQIIKNSSNNVCLTLTEKTTLSVPYYLFNFVSIDTDESILFTGTDISPNTARFNQFNIIETTGTTNFTASTISLTPGEWNYYVYQMSGSTNLALSGTSGLVESGLVTVSGASTTNHVYTGNDDADVDVYFNN